MVSWTRIFLIHFCCTLMIILFDVAMASRTSAKHTRKICNLVILQQKKHAHKKMLCVDAGSNALQTSSFVTGVRELKIPMQQSCESEHDFHVGLIGL